MVDENTIYRDLQKHLNKQAVGYPATKSGVEIRILQHIFSPEEARVATKLHYKFETVEHIFERVEESGMSIEELENMLDKMLKNGSIGYKEREGVKYYKNMPLVVGMYEGQLNKLTSEFLADIKEYTSDKKFGLEFLSTEVSQMRTIPIGKSITPEHHVATYDTLRDLLEKTDGPIVILECLCRQAENIRGKPCSKTSRLETCMALRDIAKTCIISGKGRQISKEEALEIAGKNEEDGLVLQPANAQEPEIICSCCTCCCGMLRYHKMIPRPVDFWASNYYAEVDIESCTGCGTCADRCQVNAIELYEDEGVSKVNLTRCIGCGNCVPTCESEAVYLVEKEKKVIPPKTDEDLIETIMLNKKGKWGKIKMTTKMALGMKQ